MRVYVAGAMTGKFDYKRYFMEAEETLKSMGHIVVNPAYLPEGLADYYEINKAMIDQCDAIYVLKDYINSVGTKKEIEYAEATDKEVIYEDKSSGWISEEIPVKWQFPQYTRRDPFNG